MSSGEGEGNKIIVKSCGKNLLNVNTQYIGGDRVYFNMALTKNTQYVLRGKYSLTYRVVICSATEIESNKPKEIRSLSLGALVKFNSEELQGKYILLIHETSIGVNYPNWALQLEQGTLATNYEPFVEDKKEVVLPFTGGLKGLETVQDELKYSESKVIQNIGIKDVLESSSGLRNVSGYNTTNTLFFECNLTSKSDKLLCNKFKSGKVGDRGKDEELVFIDTQWKKLCIKILKTSLDTQDLNGFKKWLQTNNLKVIYELETPMVHNLSLLDMKSFYSKTNLLLENSVKGKISGEVRVDVISIIEDLEGKNKELTRKMDLLLSSLNLENK